MNENIFTGSEMNPENNSSSRKLNKTWVYSEKLNKHTVHHTLSVQGDRLTHVSEVKEAARAMKQRSDIRLSDVRTVNSYYGLSRNLIGVIILGILSAMCLFGAIAIMAEEGGIAGGLVVLVLAAGFAGLAYLLFKRIKPAFVLEIEMYVKARKVIREKFSYGSAAINFTKKKITPTELAVMIIIWPIGLIYLLRHAKKGSVKYKFIMDPETGNDIVNTLGEYLI